MEVGSHLMLNRIKKFGGLSASQVLEMTRQNLDPTDHRDRQTFREKKAAATMTTGSVPSKPKWPLSVVGYSEFTTDDLAYCM